MKNLFPAAIGLAALLLSCQQPKPPGFSMSRGSTVSIRTVDEISTRVHRAEDPFDARLSSPIRQGPVILVPLGARVTGVVKEIRPRMGDTPAQMDLRLTRLYLPDETSVELRTSPLVREAAREPAEIVLVPKETPLIFTLEQAVILPQSP